MLIKTSIKKLENIPWIKHNKTADGYTYEKDIYTPHNPIIIEIQKGEQEYITFNEKTITITITNYIPTNEYGITITTESETNITITTTKINDYQIIIYTEKTHTQQPT